VESWINVTIEAALVYQRAGVRVGMLVGRYLDDPGLVGTVATHVATGWLQAHRGSADLRLSDLERWWNAYVERIESAAGGVDCATENDLRRAWTAHARRLVQARMDDPLWAEGTLPEPTPVRGG